MTARDALVTTRRLLPRVPRRRWRRDWHLGQLAAQASGTDTRWDAVFDPRRSAGLVTVDAAARGRSFLTRALQRVTAHARCPARSAL